MFSYITNIIWSHEAFVYSLIDANISCRSSFIITELPFFVTTLIHVK